MLTRLSKSINHYILGLSFVALVYLFFADPATLLKNLTLYQAILHSNTAIIFILTLAPLISIGVFIEQTSLEFVRLGMKFDFFKKRFPFMLEHWDEQSASKRTIAGLFYAHSPQHAFTWHTDHYVRGAFAISWAPLAVFAIMVLLKLRDFLGLSIGYLILISLVQLFLSFYLIRYGLKQINYCYRIMEEVAAIVSKDDTKKDK